MAPPKPLVLVLDRDRGVRRLVRAVLSASALRVEEVETPADALERAKASRPDVIVVDPTVPGVAAARIVGSLREACDAQVVVLAESGREQDKVEALEAGADDYITKPFASAELVARVRVALRHGANVPRAARHSVIAVGDLCMDLEKRVVVLDGAEIRLTVREYRVLEVLMKNAGAVVTQSAILREVWGPEHEARANYLREYVHQLRRKLEKDPTRPQYLITEPAVGYRIRCAT
jgi:two-component system KDP operon response regulator KdpE